MEGLSGTHPVGAKRKPRNHPRLPRSGWRTRSWTPGPRVAVLLSETQSTVGPARPRESRYLEGDRSCTWPPLVVPPDFERSDQASRLELDWPQTRSTPVLFRQPDEPCLDPLYLFARALQRHKEANASAGWELVGGLRSSGEAGRVAAALLAERRHNNLRVLDSPVRRLFPANSAA